MGTYDQLKIDNQLCHAVYSAANALTRFYNPLLSRLNLTYPQYIIMMVLWEKDGINIFAISKATLFDSGTLTPLLQKLKASGLIDIKVDQEDKRNRVIKLTRKGKNLEAKAAEIPEQLACLLPFSGEDARQFKNLARMLQEALVRHEQDDSK